MEKSNEPGIGPVIIRFLQKKGKNTVTFMDQKQTINIPKYRTVTYACIVVDYRPQKSRPKQIKNNGRRQSHRLTI